MNKREKILALSSFTLSVISWIIIGFTIRFNLTHYYFYPLIVISLVLAITAILLVVYIAKKYPCETE